MNFIPLITADHSIRADMQVKHFLYLYIISTSTTNGEAINCDHSVVDVYEKFSKNFGEDEVFDALKLLVSEELITHNGTTITVGTFIDGKRKLFVGATKQSCEEEKSKLLEYCDQYYDSFGGSIRGNVAIRMRNNIEEMFNKPFTSWNATDIANVYKYAYEVYYQGLHRELMGKEFALLKKLLTLYDASTVVRIIVLYVFSNETGIYGKTTTVESLFFHKDTLHNAIKGITSRGGTTRRKTRLKNEGF